MLGLPIVATNGTCERPVAAHAVFLDSGDGIVFVGEFGPWYSEPA